MSVFLRHSILHFLSLFLGFDLSIFFKFDQSLSFPAAFTYMISFGFSEKNQLTQSIYYSLASFSLLKFSATVVGLWCMMNWGRRFVALDSVLRRKEPFPQAMNGNKKRCSDCMTTETPLWRGGPAGPKSLCNACGIRHRKRGIPTVSLTSKGPKRRREKICGSSSSAITTTYNTAASATTAKSTFGSGGGGINLNKPPKVRFVGFGEEVFLKGSQAEGEGEKQSQWREWGEVEQAAVCLLAMSCDSVFA